jgi:hypothetical protein
MTHSTGATTAAQGRGGNNETTVAARVGPATTMLVTNAIIWHRLDDTLDCSLQRQCASVPRQRQRRAVYRRDAQPQVNRIATTMTAGESQAQHRRRVGITNKQVDDDAFCSDDSARWCVDAIDSCCLLSIWIELIEMHA